MSYTYGKATAIAVRIDINGAPNTAVSFIQYYHVLSICRVYYTLSSRTIVGFE